jgi:D-aspartate ligase
MIESDLSVPAILFGSSYTVLGTARSLGRSGIPAYCLSDNLGYLASSRYCCTMPGLPKVKEFSSLAAVLPSIPFEQAVIFPCSDHWTHEAVNLDPSLRTRFPSILPPASAVDILLNKGKLALFLQEQKFPAPLTLGISGEKDLDKWPVDRWPITFIKPCDSQKFMSLFYRKALRINSREQCLDRLSKITPEGVEVVLQEYVPGPATRHFFIDGYIDSTGVMRARFARQRVRMYPLDFGDSSALRSIPLSQLGTLPDRLGKLLTTLNYRGIYSAEFKFDERDDEYKLLEINARPWWYIAYAADCGINVAEMMYRDALGRPVTSVSDYKVGVGLVSLTNDRRAVWAMFRRGTLPFFPWLWTWLTYHRAVFNWDDPAPTLSQYWRRVKLHLGRIFGKRPAVV